MLEWERIVRASRSFGFEDAEVSQAETASNEREPLTDWGEVIRRDERERQLSSTAHFSSGTDSEACKFGLDDEEPMLVLLTVAVQVNNCIYIYSY